MDSIEKFNQTIKELDEKLKQCTAMPFLFIGSGFSQRYLDTPTWENLLKKYAEKALNNKFSWQIYKDQHHRINTLVDLYPLIASDIERDFNKNWYTNPNLEAETKKSTFEMATINPFKNSLAEDFKIKLNYEQLDQYLLDEINIFRSLENKSLAGVITTNYDNLLETLLPSFDVFIGQDELFFSDPQELCEVYKIHGCCSNPNSIIITDLDYKEFNEKNAYLASKLMTIFLEHPIIFIGYSLNDGNIRKILDSIVNCLPPEKLKTLDSRLIFVEYEKNTETTSIGEYSYASSNSSKSINMTKIKTKYFSPIFSSLLKNTSKIPIKILKRIKKDVFELIQTAEPTGKLFVNLDSIGNDDHFEVAVGVGIAQKLAQFGCTGIKANQLFKDIIFNDQLFLVSEDIAKYTLPDLLRQSAGSIPIYKYIRNIPYNQLEPSIRDKIEHDAAAFSTSAVSAVKNDSHSIPHITNMSFPKHKEYKCLTYLFANHETTIDELNWLEDYLKDEFNKDPNLLCQKKDNNQIKPIVSDMKRLIKLYDWLRYYKKQEDDSI